MSPLQPKRLEHIPELDGMRGLAIASVLVLHTFGGAAIPVVGRLSRLGWAGVDLFFVLSGFLITRILLNARTEPDYYKNFYARRALRILPLYYVVLCLGFIAGAALPPPFGFNFGWSDVLAHVVFLQNWATRDHFGFWPIQVGWSLAIEEQFYLIWPLIVRSLAPQTLRSLLLVVLCASPVARVFALADGVPPITVYLMTPFRLDGLAVGALVAVSGSALVPNQLARARRSGAAIVTLSLGALALLADQLLLGDRVLVQARPLGWVQSLAMGLSLSLAAVGFGAGLWWVVHFGRGGSLVGTFLRWWPLRFLGTISFGLYLIHAAVIPVVHQVIQPALTRLWGISGRTLSVVAILLEWALFLGLATASWYGFESRLLRLRSRFQASSGPHAPGGMAPSISH